MLSFLLPLVPQSKPQGSPHLLPQAELTLPPFPQHTNKDNFKVYLLHESELQLGKTKILQKKIGFEIPNPWGIVCSGCFSNAIYPLFMLLTLQIICQGQAEHDTTFETSY